MKKPKSFITKKVTLSPHNEVTKADENCCLNCKNISHKHCNVQSINVNGKRLITSKNIPKSLFIRKPEKECYCFQEFNEGVCRSKKSQQKPIVISILEQDCCKIVNEFATLNEVNNITPYSKDDSAISRNNCEILNKIQSIIYPPKSQFLKNKLIQTKSCANCNEIFTQCESNFGISDSKTITETNRSRQTCHTNCPVSTPYSIKPRSKSSTRSSKPKNVQYKIISTQTSDDFTTKKKNVQTKNVACSIFSQVACKVCKQFSCPGMCHNENQKLSVPKVEEDLKRDSKYKNYLKNQSDDDILDLYKFRKQNYFETHGSTCSSNSAGSLEHYMINERLFPHFCGSMHNHDLVVTMPPCATKQKKVVHYFPSNVISQDKVKGYLNTSKKYHTCPLVGHAFDVDILKKKYLPNSLALKYQKTN